MNRLTETIKDYEYITAGRFYSNAQKDILFKLVSDANMLHENEKSTLKALIFSSEIDDCKSEIDCANGLLLASVLNKSEYKQEILSNRKQTLLSLSGRRQFDSKEYWLKFIHSSAQKCNLFEKAIYLCSVQKDAQAIEIIKDFAENCYCLFIKLAAAIFRKLRNVNGEARYLILYSRIQNDLLYEKIPSEFEDRMREISSKVPDNIINEANNIKLIYFCGDFEQSVRIGF